ALVFGKLFQALDVFTYANVLSAGKFYRPIISWLNYNDRKLFIIIIEIQKFHHQSRLDHPAKPIRDIFAPLSEAVDLHDSTQLALRLIFDPPDKKRSIHIGEHRRIGAGGDCAPY